MAQLLLVIAFLAAGMVIPAGAEGLIPPLTPEQASEARQILESFQANPRGPFYRIQWFCNDGTVHPPAPPPCKERGGGFQYASLSAETKKLAGWNIDVGTIYASLSFDKLFDAGRDHHRLKQLVLEKYLEEVDSGWIYRRAYTYRGARQIEDEEKIGYRFLTKLLADPDWTNRNFLLATQLIGVVPHGLPNSAVRKARNLAKAIADQDSRFQNIRAKIHSAPGDEDLTAVERFLQERAPSEAVKTLLTELASLLKQERAGRDMAARLPNLKKSVEGSSLDARVESFADALKENDPAKVFAASARLSFELRQQATSSAEGKRNLELLDFNAMIQEIGFRTRPDVSKATRAERLGHLLDHFRLAAGAGMLSMREFEALEREVQRVQPQKEIAAEDYRRSVRYVARAAEWARASVAKQFGVVAQLYAPAEPLAASLLDHVLRGSAALPMSNEIERLVDDADRSSGIRHSFFGEPSSRGITALNPGVARGKLHLLESSEQAAGNIDASGIYVVPQTVSDLKPMAGILTLDSGNALSHTQLLAANLGIPNASVPSALLPALRQREGREVLYGVSARGVVVLQDWAELSEEQRGAWERRPQQDFERMDLDTSRLRLDDRRLYTLSELNREDSGVIVGPKAANLGGLAQDFPGKVAPGIVIPFGIFYQHISRKVDGRPSLAERVAAAYQEADRMRDAGDPDERIQAFIYPYLAGFRREIETMDLIPEFRREFISKIEQHLEGAHQTHGVFIRSDTNAEDLPQFTGAGLNLTVPNQVGMDNILASIKRVWASPFSERAYEWRSRAFRGNDKVYPSVIVMRSVPSDKSGVLATANLETGDASQWTVNVSEGVSAVVDGGVAESLLVGPGDEVTLLQQSRAAYRKVCSTTGGFDILPPRGPDHLLSDDEIAQLRELVAEVNQKYPSAMGPSGQPLPWDIEFGFENGKLRLFQIRPLVRAATLGALEGFQAFDSGAVLRVALDQPLMT